MCLNRAGCARRLLVELKARIIVQITLQQRNTLYSLGGKRVSPICPLCIQHGKYSFNTGIMTGNAGEKFCCLKKLGMEVRVTALLKVFSPLVTN
jgi:hypothetical protein